MSKTLVNQINEHVNTKLFTAAIEYTAVQTGFNPELVEKDYYCSLILSYLSSKSHSLVFKGGTLLAKVHAGFYRLSEDLDFTLPISTFSTRKQRSNLAKPIKPYISNIPNFLPILTLKKELTGSNESRQYNSEIVYTSCLDKSEKRILIEIGLREELKTPIFNGKINTLLLNPFSETPLPSFNFPCLSKCEAYAEKIRAALCRKKLAIRDFYDLDYAYQNNIIDFDDMTLITLVKKKIEFENNIHDFSDPVVIKHLNSRIKSELVPTLKKPMNFEFNLTQIVKFLSNLKTRLEKIHV